MAWLPNWSLPRFEILITHTDEDYCSTHEVEVVEEGVGLFRLYDFPYCEGLRWGDLIRAVKYDDCLEYIEIMERAEHSFDGWGITNNRYAGLILKDIMKAGGFWADDAFFGFDIAVPPGFDVEKWERDNKDAIEANDWPDTQYDKRMKHKAGKISRMREFKESMKRNLGKGEFSPQPRYKKIK